MTLTANQKPLRRQIVIEVIPVSPTLKWILPVGFLISRTQLPVKQQRQQLSTGEALTILQTQLECHRKV